MAFWLLDIISFVLYKCTSVVALAFVVSVYEYDDGDNGDADHVFDDYCGVYGLIYESVNLWCHDRMWHNATPHAMNIFNWWLSFW